jgi:fructokinase
MPAEQLPPEHPAWKLEAHYLALAIANFAFTLSCERVIVGGGVMQQAQLFPQIRSEVAQLVNGYIPIPEIVPASPGKHAGVCGALVLAEQAQLTSYSPARRSS